MALFLSVPGCRRAEPEGLRRVALLPFEFQGSDTENQWLASALEVAVVDQMRNAAGVIPVRAADRNTAVAQGATELLSAVVSGQPGALRFRLYHESLARQTVRAESDGKARSIGETLEALRQSLAAAGVAGAVFSTENEEAFTAFGRALVTKDPVQAVRLLESAVAADAQFATASLRLSSYLQTAGRTDAATSEAERLLAALPAERKLDRAYASLQLASLRNDNPGLERALAAVVDAAPNDLEAANRLAALYQQRRKYGESARILRQVVTLDSANPSLWNQITYAEAFGGNRNAALAALGEYRKVAPDDPNVDDTEGDVHYFFGAFTEAAASYESAHARNEQWQAGFALFKSAWARMYAGDLPGADTAMNRYLGILRPLNAGLADFRSAQWQFLRGRREEARSALTAILGQSDKPGAYRSLVATQLYVWDLAEGKLGQLIGEFRSGKPRYGTHVTPALAALLEGTRAGMTPAQRAAAITPVVGGAQQNVLIAAATFLDARDHGSLSGEALQALVLADQSIPEATAMVTHSLVGWGFLERGEPGEAALQFVRRIPPVVSDDGLLWPLVFPACLRWELDAWKGANQTPPAPQLEKIADELTSP